MKTTKLSLAAALISLGAELDYVDKKNPRHMEFHLTFSAPFMDENEWLDSMVRAWESREMMVNARDYEDALQKLKVEVHN